MERNFSIATDRLTLRALSHADIPAMVALLDDYEVSRWLSVVPHPYTRGDAEGFLDFLQTAGPLAARGIIGPEGLVGVVGIDPGAMAGLGYWLGRAHHGKGYMSEAAGALVARFFAASDADQLTSGHFAGNVASARVLERLGFVSNGNERVKSRAQGTEVTLKKMILTRTDWQARHAD